MNPSTLEQRYLVIRERAARGAEVATFTAFEQLWKDARAAGDERLAKRILRDLAVLTAQLDPQIARELAAASIASPDAARVELSVVVLGVPQPASNSPVMASLQHQSLAPGRFETIVADRDDAASCNAALRAAKGEVILFLAHDLTLSPDALLRHLTAHAGGGPSCAVMGAVEWENLALRPLAWALDSVGLLGCQAGVDSAGDVPAECLALVHASFPRGPLLESGGINEGISAFAGPELGVRLAAAGWRITIDPAIGGRRTPATDLDGWLTRCRAMGGDWSELRRLHGGAAPPSWLRDIGLEESVGDSLFDRLLGSADRHSRCVSALHDSLTDIEQVVARSPDRALTTLEKLASDLTAAVLEVTRHELLRGFAHSIGGGTRDALERCAVRTVRGAAVLVLSSDHSVEAARVALSELPQWAELLVGVQEGAPEWRLPEDRRIRRLLLPKGATAPVLKQALLNGTGADFFVLLDGSCVPTCAEWTALRLTLSTLPCVGACSVDGEPAPLAHARMCQRLPNALVAVRRDVIESDGGEAGSLLERLVRKGYRLATAAPARVESACAP
ncbi:MAG: glycosyltransferase family 2 protein [Planctomycetes bacterium]|nr:glycosyltransferase family 2 protein [Planctomycetota bacterium]